MNFLSEPIVAAADKSIYLDLDTKEHGVQATTVVAGGAEVELQVSTTKHGLSAFAQQCETCFTPSKYFHADNTLAEIVTSGAVENGIYQYKREYPLAKNLKYNFNGDWIKETVVLDGREDTTVPDLQMMNISRSEPYIVSQTDGFIGIAVGNEQLPSPDYDLIQQLKQKNIIDHHKFGLWVSSDPAYPGHLQLGDWNKDAFLNPDDAKVFETDYQYSVITQDFKMGEVEVPISANARAMFDPSFGYGIFLPQNDYYTVMTKLNQKIFYSLRDEETHLFPVCKSYEGMCFAEYTCDYVRSTLEKQNQRLDLSLVLQSGDPTEPDNKFTINIPQEQLLLDEDNQGNESCKIPIYQIDQQAVDNLWVLGSLVSQNYYTYIDASDESEEAKVYMGIGEKNPDFMKPDPINPDDPTNPSGSENTVIIGLVVAILVVTCLICFLLYRKKKRNDLNNPVNFSQYQDFGDVKSNKKDGLMTAKEKDLKKVMNINESNTDKLSKKTGNDSTTLKSGSDW